ncbi:hypothetical protein ACTWP5_21810 [Streptomyces sp. 4N509B]|uniref:hypothetical protein n=1 Tax=Streptomyces sp. 4N509B TaxID=3457413 RepID=UPI003FCF3C00
MCDLYIDYDMLERTRSNLTNITEILESPTDEISSWGTQSAGVEELSNRLGEFDDEWDYGIGKIREFATNAGEMLAGLIQAWQQYDLDLAKALRENNQ